MKCSQAWQIFPIYIDERGFGVHIVPIQRRGVIDEQPLRPCNSNKAFNGFLYSGNELIVVDRVFPTEPNEKWVWSLARLASSRGGES